MSNDPSHLGDSHFSVILFACLVKKLGGKVKIIQSDIDEVAYCKLIETGDVDGSLEFTLKQRTVN